MSPNQALTAAFVPYADEETALTMDTMVIENRLDCVTVYGSADITKDQQGLRIALALKAVLDAVVTTLQADPDLPEHIASPIPPTEPRDPFA